MEDKQKAGGKAVTTVDLAAHSGVSVITVSRVLNHPEKVSEHTKQKVYKAINELGYSSTPGKSSHIRKRRPCIGVITGSLIEPIFIAMVSAIQSLASEHNIDVYLHISEFSNDEELHFIAQMRDYGALCVVCVGISASFDESFKKHELFREMPLLVLGDETALDYVDFIDVDAKKCMLDSVQHLAELGHKKIALLLGWRLRSRRSIKRLEYFREALEKNGLEFDNNLVRVMGDIAAHDVAETEAGDIAMQSLLQGKSRPTAVLAHTGSLCMGVIKAGLRAGLRTPEDISVMSLGDDIFCEYMNPTISAASNQKDMLMMLLEQYMTAIFVGGGKPDQWKYTLPSQLLLRESTAGVKKG